MLDIIGYWLGVTVISGSLLAFPCALLIMIYGKMLHQALPKEDAEKAFGKVYYEQWVGGCHGYEKRFFGRKVNFSLSDYYFFSVMLTLISALVFFFTAAIVFPNKEVYQEVGGHLTGFSEHVIFLINSIASFAAPIVSWVAVASALYFGGIFLIRAVYFGKKFKEKVDAHMNNKDIHKGE